MTLQSIAEVSELLRHHDASPVDLVSECLGRIERLNPTLRAFITVTADLALEQAKHAEAELGAGKWKGPLHGVPIAIKDFFDTAGIRTTAAFARFEHRVPIRDAEAVRKLKDAGAIIVGKTNMHELGMGNTSVVSHFGAVANPWNMDYVAGGSSGGSAAAVAAGMCYATLDTDAIGSCRLPAACCGVTGFKATYGLVSTKGILDGEPADEFIIHMGHAAFTCRTAGDAVTLLNVLGDPDLSQSAVKMDYRKALGEAQRLRVGVVENFSATAEVRTVFLTAVETLRALGYPTTEITAPVEFSGDLGNIEDDRKKISGSLFKRIDALVLPTTTGSTPTIAQAKEGGPQAVSPGNTIFANYYGLPAMSIPCGFDKNGMPFGMQIVGPRWGEGNILAIAHRFQQATNWHFERPLRN